MKIPPSGGIFLLSFNRIDKLLCKLGNGCIIAVCDQLFVIEIRADADAVKAHFNKVARVLGTNSADGDKFRVGDRRADCSPRR